MLIKDDFVWSIGGMIPTEGKPKYSVGNLSSTAVSTTKLTRTGLRPNQDLHSEQLASNCHDIA
jgi:hypothetical protein